MSKITVNRSKIKNLSKDELLKLNKEELVDRIIQLEAHNFQLKHIITKNLHDKNENSSDSSKNNKKFNFDKYNKRRILLRLAYFGKQYRGLATQEDCTNTIEHYLFNALVKSKLIPSRDQANYHRCGRTDKGVSASGQVISLIVRSQLSTEELDSEENILKEIPYCKILNRLLPNDIRAVSWIPIDTNENGEPFSARFDCKRRVYKYWFPKLSLNIEAMKQACKYLEGSHDFRNLCKMDVGNGVTTYIRNIHSADVFPENSGNCDNEYSMYYLKIIGNAFLWHQIRCIAGLLFLIGSDSEKPSVIQQLLDVENCPRKPQYNMAIDSPLNLFRCSYNILKNDNVDLGNDLQSEENLKAQWWCVDLEELTLVIKCFREQWAKAAIDASMIKDVIHDLEKLYDLEVERKTTENDEIVLFKDELRKKIFSMDDLVQGVKPKTYIPLLKRPMCETLENRIKHYVKKKRLNTKESPEKQKDF